MSKIHKIKKREVREAAAPDAHVSAPPPSSKRALTLVALPTRPEHPPCPLTATCFTPCWSHRVPLSPQHVIGRNQLGMEGNKRVSSKHFTLSRGGLTIFRRSCVYTPGPVYLGFSTRPELPRFPWCA